MKHPYVCISLLLALGVSLPVHATKPGETVDHSNLTQNWDKVIIAGRFSVLADFNNLAVRDNETGLVWEKSPSLSPAADWVQAAGNCVNKSIANRKGWRLPSVAELGSLIDISQSNPTLPAGHPFTNVQADADAY